MKYTAYSEQEFKELPKKYKRIVVGIKENNEIIQVPLCPECGGEMMEQQKYLSCISCGCIRKLRVIK